MSTTHMYLPVEQLYVVMCKIQEVESGCVDITLETRQYTTPSFVASFGCDNQLKLRKSGKRVQSIYLDKRESRSREDRSVGMG